jgi:hypothetical protein
MKFLRTHRDYVLFLLAIAIAGLLLVLPVAYGQTKGKQPSAAVTDQKEQDVTVHLTAAQATQFEKARVDNYKCALNEKSVLECNPVYATLAEYVASLVVRQAPVRFQSPSSDQMPLAGVELRGRARAEAMRAERTAKGPAGAKPGPVIPGPVGGPAPPAPAKPKPVNGKQ